MWKRRIQQFLQTRRTVLTALAIAFAILGLQFLGAFELIECVFLDNWLRIRPPENSQSRVVIVTISEEEITRLGSWPISDAILAETLTIIKKQKPQVIGLDLYRNLPVGDGNQALQNVFLSTPNLIAVEKVLNGNHQGVAAPQLLKKRGQVAASDLILDSDSHIRRYLISLQSDEGKTYLTLGTKLALHYLAAQNIHQKPNSHNQNIRLGKAVFSPLAPNTGGYVKTDFGGYQLLANFQIFKQGVTKISLRDVLDNKIPPNLMQGKIVIIGSTAESVSSKFYNAYTENIKTAWFGVEFHADLANQIIAAAIDGRPILRGVPELVEWVWVFAWSWLGSWWGWSICKKAKHKKLFSITSSSSLVWQENLPQKVIICLFLLTFSLGLSGYLLFLSGRWITIAAPYLACMSSFAINHSYRLRKGLLVYRQRLANYTQSLELKVQERTQALQENNIALQTAKLAAEKANLAKSTFLASMSHELRTPLNIILGFTQVMDGATNLTNEQHIHLETINRAGEHLLSLINDILEISKIEAGRVVVNQHHFDLWKLLRDLEKMFAFKARTKKLDFSVNIAVDTPQYIQSDEGKIRQVLINLLGNAIKFTEQGKISLRVRFEPDLESPQYQSINKSINKAINKPIEVNSPNLDVSGSLVSSQNAYANVDENLTTALTTGQLKIDVEDTGIGIASESLKRIFTAFEQIEPSYKSAEGSGLGLTISYKFIQLMGGDIQVKSQEGQGSIFMISLPITSVPVPHHHSSQFRHSQINTNLSDIKTNPSSYHQSNYKILVVDDHQGSRELLVNILNSVGFIIKQAENGAEAIELCSTWQPDLICMDMQMPVVDGYQASRTIKYHLQGKQIPIIAISANAFVEDREKALLAGCDDFLSKPFQKTALIAMIAKYLPVNLSDYSLTICKPPPSNNFSETDVKLLLSQTPAHWGNKLYKACCLCDDSQVFELLTELPRSQQQLIDAITSLAHDFRFDLIIELLDHSNK